MLDLSASRSRVDWQRLTTAMAADEPLAIAGSLEHFLLDNCNSYDVLSGHAGYLQQKARRYLLSGATFQRSILFDVLAIFIEASWPTQCILSMFRRPLRHRLPAPTMVSCSSINRCSCWQIVRAWRLLVLQIPFLSKRQFAATRCFRHFAVDAFAPDLQR